MDLERLKSVHHQANALKNTETLIGKWILKIKSLLGEN